MTYFILRNKNTGKLVFSEAKNYKELEEKLLKTDIPFEVLGIAEDLEGKVSVVCERCDQEFKIWKFDSEITCPHCMQKQFFSKE